MGPTQKRLQGGQYSCSSKCFLVCLHCLEASNVGELCQHVFIFQHFFEEQLKKHSPLCDLIQKNLDAQDVILR